MAFARNTNQIDFNIGQSGQDADQWSGWTAASGGTRLVRRALANNPAALGDNQFYRVAANTFELEAPVGQVEAPMARRAAAGMVLDGVHVQLEQSSDDSALTNRLLIAQADWTIS